MGLVVGLQAHEHRCLGGAIQLFEVDANRSIKAKQIGADGLARRVGDAHARKAQCVAQWAVHEQIARGIGQAVEHAHGFAIHQRRAHAPRQRHAGLKHGLLDLGRVFHPDHYAGEQAFKHARRCEVIRGPHFLQVDADRGCRLGAIHHIAAHQPLGKAEDVLAYPGRRQVGQDFLIGRQFVKPCARLCAVDQGGVGVHDALGVAGGARGEEQGGNIVRLALRDVCIPRAWVGRIPSLTGGQQVVQRRQAGLCVTAQAARVVKPDAGKPRADLAQLDELVHLLLVFHHGKADVGVLNREGVFGRGGVLVQRHGDATQRLRGQLRCVQARPVVADHRQVVATPKPCRRQPAGHLAHGHSQLSPSRGLPDAQMLFTQRAGAGALGCVVKQEAWKSAEHMGKPGCPAEVAECRWMPLAIASRPQGGARKCFSHGPRSASRTLLTPR